jgi:hypothetical protein
MTRDSEKQILVGQGVTAQILIGQMVKKLYWIIESGNRKRLAPSAI